MLKINNPASSKSFMEALISTISLGIKYYFEFTILEYRGTSNVFYLSSLHSDQIANIVALPFAEYGDFPLGIQNLRNNLEMSSEPHWIHCKMDLSQNTINHSTSINSYSMQWRRWFHLAIKESQDIIRKREKML